MFSLGARAADHCRGRADSTFKRWRILTNTNRSLAPILIIASGTTVAYRMFFGQCHAVQHTLY